MKFAELHAGQHFTLGPEIVDPDEVAAFAERYDAQWFHVDPERAEAGPWNGIIASGWHTCALAMSLMSKQLLKDSDSFGSPGLSHLRWPNPVRPGDQLTLQVHVHETRRSVTKPWLGIVRWQWIMKNQDGVEVLDIEATSLFNTGE
ncbi:MAG: dehydratase [Herbaspirillum sp.]|jgi:acyl dehydratase|nr:dehydratase [Herbaspirillum sp.]